MIRRVVSVACAIVLLGAQPQTPSPARQDNMAPVTAPRPPSDHPPQLAVDETFAIAAMQGDAAELAAAQLAVRRTQSDGIAAFARQMIADHTTIAQAGAPLLRRYLTRMPPKFAPPDALAMQYLSSVPPVDFDQNYAMLQIADHLASEAAFMTEARDGSDARLKAFAQKWLPTIQAHVQLAVTLVKHVGGDTPFKH